MSGKEEQPWPESNRMRVLSLDGGGIKGTFSAGFLAGIEEGTGKKIGDYFDLIVGTSTGGIIALGLGLGLSASEILDFYRREGDRIFGKLPGPSGLSFLKQFWTSKYSNDGLRETLESIFGSRVLGDSKSRLVIVSYDGLAGGIHLLKTQHIERFKRDRDRRAVEVALATSAAPLFFPASEHDGRVEIDGGVWASCPALVGAVEATRVLGALPEMTSILSVGTTSEPFYVKRKWRVGGILRWRRNLIDLLMNAQVSGAIAQAQLIVGKENFMRVDHVVEPRRFSLDSASDEAASELASLGRRAARHHEPEVERRFLDQLAAPFSPAPK